MKTKIATELSKSELGYFRKEHKKDKRFASVINKTFAEGVVRGREVEKYIKRYPSKRKLYKMS